LHPLVGKRLVEMEGTLERKMSDTNEETRKACFL
jgi:hypothetical protein